jgi:hypothetical protein
MLPRKGFGEDDESGEWLRDVMGDGSGKRLVPQEAKVFAKRVPTIKAARAIGHVQLVAIILPEKA